MLWDGLGFFGFDDAKLARLRGEKVTFMTRFKSMRWIIVTTMMIAMGIYILISELLKYDSVRSSVTSLSNEAEYYSYAANDVLTICVVQYFYVDGLIQKAKQYRDRNWNRRGDSEFSGMLPEQQIPDKFDDFNWIDKNYLEWYTCKHATT